MPAMDTITVFTRVNMNRTQFYLVCFLFPGAGGGNDIQWCFSQVKGAVDDDVAEGKRAFNNAEFG